MGHKVTTPPASEPVSLSEARAHLKVDGTDEDAYIGALITAARESCEACQGRAYVEQTITLTLDGFPCSGRIELPRPPLLEVTSVKYIDSLGAEQTIDPGDYYVDNSSDTEPAVLIPAYARSWPTTREQAGAVTIVYTAGYAPGQVPKATTQAILSLVAHMFENREAVARGMTELPLGVDRLLSHHKVYTIP